MKKILLFLFSITPILLFARTPEWISSRPNNSSYYWGIGVCELSNWNFKEVAKQQARNEITQQISFKIENNSFMSMSEMDVVDHEDYLKKIQASSQVYLEDLQIFDTYQDKKNFYVCCRINKDEYKAKVIAQSKLAVKSAYEYLQQAREAEDGGNLISAIAYYQKGLEVVEPWLFIDMSYEDENVPVALCSGYKSVFDGLTLILHPRSTTTQNLKAVNTEIKVLLYKDGVPVPNIPLIAKFEIGAGKITHSVKTDLTGTGRFYLTQLSSKEASQSIKICVDKTILKELPEAFRSKTVTRQLPEALFMINVEQQDVVFYINPINNTIPPLLRQIASILSSEYFEVSTNSSEATHIIDIATDLRKVGIVQGDLENLDEWSATLNVAIRSKEGSVLTHYSVEGVRVLVSENSSQTVASQQASKELAKRFKREFPKQLEKVNIK